MFAFKKTEIHLFSNQLVGNVFFDNFYYYITYLGDGNVAMVILPLLLIYNLRVGIYVTLTFVCASLTSIALKHFVFDDANRPFFIFNYFERKTLRLVDGVDIYIHNSFPSGHATQAFAILISLAFCLPNKFHKLILFILALLTAYSRVYISQHWLIDITAGSLIGLCFSFLFYFLIFENHKISMLNFSLLKYIKK
jgi:membrane-associated phospholipid phosphatase